MLWRSMPPVTKNLIVINLALWVVMGLIPPFDRFMVNRLGLHLIGAPLFNPVQPITYMFLHGGALHVLFNMFTLWMFGRTLEQVWGSRRYFVFYMVCGIGAALFQELVWSLTFHSEIVDAYAANFGLTKAHAAEVVDQLAAAGNANYLRNAEILRNSFVTIGASGAVFGLLLGFAMTFPDMPLYLFFIPVPIKAKYMVIGYAVIEFFLGVNGGGTVAHFAHLGGMLFGLILLLYWKHNGPRNRWRI